MAKRSSSRGASISPIHPSMHFILFLAMALILVVVVAVVMQKVSVQTRASLVCPQANLDPVKLVENMSAQCPTGVEYVSDANGCGTWVCKMP